MPQCNDWSEYSNSCYYFGDHATYDEANYFCEKNNAQLAHISQENGKYLLGYIKNEGNKNSHWVKSGNVGGERASVSDDVRCPMLKGSTSKPE